MSSFFNKPSWASTQDDGSTANFYQRSQHIYADIVAATQRSRSKETDNTDAIADIEDGGAAKKPRISHSNEDVPASEISDGDRRPSPEVASNSDVVESARDSSPTNLNSDVLESAPVPETDRLSEVKPDNSHCSDPLLLRKDTEGSPVQPLGREHSTRDESRATAGASHGESGEDPIIQILITSNIENTMPLIVRRKMSQRLRDVRLAWCKRQGFDKDMTASVFLTWKGRRLFDVTTCKSLGIGRQNRASSQGLWDVSDELGDKEESMQIHVEAVTDLPVAPSRQQIPSDSTNEPISKVGVVSDDRQESTGGLIRMILKSPGYGELRAKVTPNTRISNIIASFRDSQHISAEKQIYLLFDGERLSTDSCVSDYDIADLDMVDVQVK
ncbi:ubiquitin-2 like Rad60 SUMO-like-domain-containing protein [Paecilomyces variotii]|uniref:Ubiquitin-2 like Rad60 SUMO-like-domain-containing protein n=1 Tax=Byssochlamys spectabilis TaxID=264951 RepID=A0A443I6D9_BYSSP|nr:ubiquitin-2 like Rad60 SUMO-like-domain-containing protein [Paecilomyces variotii]RWQ99545.1 ubiquitin-2 like Rad60 SUMO-like-domain-containing protein [Paecilomyces variotii]